MLPAIVMIHIIIEGNAMRSVIVGSALSDVHSAANESCFDLSKHAQIRMSQRSIDVDKVQQVLTYGRMIRSRSAMFYVIGRKDIKKLGRAGIDARLLENIQVVVDERSNRILTVYRNEDFRQIRPKHRRERRM